MALDAEYFDSIYIDVVKKKYYNANKVRAVFEDIRRQAEELNAENIALRRQLAELNGRKVELGDALLSAQAIYQEIVDRAKVRGREIVAEAEKRRDEILQETQRQQDYSVSRVEESFARLRQMHLDSIETINAEWQGFLCGLYPEPEEPVKPEEPVRPEEPVKLEEPEEPKGNEVPEDLEEKVGAIANQVFSLEQDGEAL